MFGIFKSYKRLFSNGAAEDFNRMAAFLTNFCSNESLNFDRPDNPGPDNPLGTRWIGLNVGSVGFHGTPYPDSVGTKASHGCMRMRLVDIEDLYDRVTVGTQVRIYSGSEDDHALHHYWH